MFSIPLHLSSTSTVQEREKRQKEIDHKEPFLTWSFKIYVNKISSFMILLYRTNSSIILNAPRRMGKSATLTTLWSIKLIRTEDLKLLLG